MKKRWILLIFIIFVFAILLFPIKHSYKDGGTVEYRAILYSVIFWHRLDENYESGFYEATEFKFLPFNYLD